MGNLSKNWVYIDGTKVFVSAAGTGTREHLNADLPPDDPNAKTKFGYLSADGSDDGAFLNAAAPPIPPGPSFQSNAFQSNAFQSG